MDGWMDGLTEGRTDGRTDIHAYLLYICMHACITTCIFMHVCCPHVDRVQEAEFLAKLDALDLDIHSHENFARMAAEVRWSQWCSS